MTPAEIKALEQQVLQLDEQRCKVLVAKDGPGLAALIDAGLTYTHASGRRDTKRATSTASRQSACNTYRLIARK